MSSLSPAETRRAAVEAAPAWVACEHQVKICAGPSTQSMAPTGEHPECFREFLVGLVTGEDDA